MVIAVPQFHLLVVGWINIVLTLVTLVVEIGAFAHCLVQRSDSFPAIGTFSKGLWLALIGGTTLFALLGLGTVEVFSAPVQGSAYSGMLSLLIVTVALIYLLDIRPAVRDVAGGRGPW
ncbi:MAG: DUF2516 family protein [Dactylosporangium sp.]|nr:DUF2516 family protein [Dactylosporangium sp.]NNJ61734.1 DUF2516 family protein [Dactylosporangium sp.]